MITRRLLLGGAWLGLGALALAACSVVESQRIVLDAPPMAYGTPCASTLGSYSLPKAFLHVRIGQKSGQPPDIAVNTLGAPPVNVVRHPDPKLFFCLDHLNSPTSDDKVRVLKWPTADNGPKGSFLGAVLVNVTDRSAYIIRALIRAAFIAISGDPNFSPRSTANFDPSEIIADYEFDPFNQREAATINAQLSKLGFCLVLEDYMFDPAIGVQRYCDAPLRHSVELTRFFKAYHKLEETSADPLIPGLLYRPPHPYRLFIYRKLDAGGPDKWLLQQTTTVELENLSPVLSLRITRALFANKTVHFVFQEGTLKNACLSKTSELEGFVVIPLEIARSIVAVPASIIQVRINSVEQETSLIRAQERLYQMQKAYLDAVLGKNPTVTGAPKSQPTKPNVDLGLPSDLTPPQSTSVTWDNDLFNKVWKDVCGGDST